LILVHDAEIIGIVTVNYIVVLFVVRCVRCVRIRSRSRIGIPVGEVT
jgi:hypothetical protein